MIDYKMDLEWAKTKLKKSKSYLIPIIYYYNGYVFYKNGEK